MTPEQQSIHLTGELARLQGEVSRLERKLEHERQDRKQADLDTIRALGERNDARKALEQERQLADDLAATLANLRGNGLPAYTQWRKSRNEAVNPQ